MLIAPRGIAEHADRWQEKLDQYSSGEFLSDESPEKRVLKEKDHHDVFQSASIATDNVAKSGAQQMQEASQAKESKTIKTGYRLPFDSLPGPGTWYISQPYGNSVYAFFERKTLYSSGQGLHMGLDFAAPCGTPVLAIADGVVKSVDGRGGAPPHNLIIDHLDGRASFYGHLRDRAHVRVGEFVRQGEVVAVSGDMYETCKASPHLHLEIRNEALTRFYNPVDLIDADWHSILLLGSGGLSYERDMDAPRRWQSLDDQPTIQLGGPLLNEFGKPWPSDR